MYSPREEVTAGRTERCNHATYYLVRLMKVIATRFCVTRAASVDTFLSSPHFISFLKFHRTWCTSRFFYLLFLWRRQRKSTSRPIVSSSFDSKHSLDWFVIYSSGHEMMSSHFHLGPGHNVESDFVTLHLLSIRFFVWTEKLRWSCRFPLPSWLVMRMVKKTIHIRYVSTKKKKGQIIIILGAKRMANVTRPLRSFIFIFGVFTKTKHRAAAGLYGALVGVLIHQQTAKNKTNRWYRLRVVKLSNGANV